MLLPTPKPFEYQGFTKYKLTTTGRIDSIFEDVENEAYINFLECENSADSYEDIIKIDFTPTFEVGYYCKEIATKISKINDIRIIQWFYENYGSSFCFRYFLHTYITNVVMKKFDSIVKYCKLFEEKFNLSMAFAKGYLLAGNYDEFIKYNIYNINYIGIEAIRGGNKEILKLLNKKKLLTTGDFANVCGIGNHDLIDLFLNFGFKFTHDCAKNAAMYGTLETLKYLRSNKCPWDLNKICESSVYNNNDEMFFWIHEQSIIKDDYGTKLVKINSCIFINSIINFNKSIFEYCIKNEFKCDSNPYYYALLMATKKDDESKINFAKYLMDYFQIKFSFELFLNVSLNILIFLDNNCKMSPDEINLIFRNTQKEENKKYLSEKYNLNYNHIITEYVDSEVDISVYTKEYLLEHNHTCCIDPEYWCYHTTCTGINLNNIIGQNSNDVTHYFESNCICYRFDKFNNLSIAITCDYIDNRFNLSIENDILTKISFG